MHFQKYGKNFENLKKIFQKPVATLIQAINNNMFLIIVANHIK